MFNYFVILLNYYIRFRLVYNCFFYRIEFIEILKTYAEKGKKFIIL